MKIGLATGRFDLFHDGHRYFLREAEKLCDWLIVAVNADARALSQNSLPYRVAMVMQYLERNVVRWSVVPFDGADCLLASCLRPDVRIIGYDQSVSWGTIPVIQLEKGPDVSTTSILKGEVQ